MNSANERPELVLEQIVDMPEKKDGVNPHELLRVPPESSARARYRSFKSAIQFTDLVVVAAAVAVAQVARFGSDSPTLAGHPNIEYTLFSVALIVAWMVALIIAQTTDMRYVGEGATEYARVIRGTLGVFGLVAIVATVFKVQIARGYVAAAFPIGLFFLLFSRWLWRKRFVYHRENGRLQHRVIVVGGSTLAELLAVIRAANNCAWNVVGLCSTNGNKERLAPDLVDASVPLIYSWRDVRRLASETHADAVAVSGVESIGMQGMRELSWDLEGLGVELLVAPGVMDVAGPRMHFRPVAGLPLIQVDKPRYEGANRLTKAMFDKIGAGIILLIASPVFLFCAAAVRFTSVGPVFYLAERIGLNDEPFGMFKFRTMIQDADRIKKDLVDQNEIQGGVLFKMRNDPRVTAVGRILRRFSIDELPQLINVIKGDMSLVGPRPPLREEVNEYSGLTSRRMLVKPGMTGLWQVSGRSNLSWEESVRLDLTYVENWSLTQDCLILWKTVRAVLMGSGAY